MKRKYGKERECYEANALRAELRKKKREIILVTLKFRA